MAKKNVKRFSLSVQFASGDEAIPSRPQIRRWAKAAAERDVQVTVRFVDASEGRALNREFRHKDYATNVLSFAYDRDPVVGDLLLCVPVIKREAKQQRKDSRAHFAHMIVHGMLHLQGYDHESSQREAERMEAREREILTRFGIADPY